MPKLCASLSSSFFESDDVVSLPLTAMWPGFATTLFCAGRALGALVALAGAAAARGLAAGHLLRLLLGLALGGRAEELLHEHHLVAIHRVGVVGRHLRHEHRERRDDGRVTEERETDEARRAARERGEEADRGDLARADGADLERDGLARRAVGALGADLEGDRHAVRERELGGAGELGGGVHRALRRRRVERLGLARRAS